jgi:putative transposase
MSETDYQSDVSDEQWQILERLLPVSRLGRPPLDRRWVINAILYVLWTGCPWRALHSEFPNWRSVYTVFRRWRLYWTWERLHAALRGRACIAAGKMPTSTTVIVDSQTAKTKRGGDH